MDDTAPNPLAEGSIVSLDELMSRDPFQYTKTDRGQIVEALRRQRVNWLKAEAGGAKSAPKAKAATRPAPAKLDLDDLGL